MGIENTYEAKLQARELAQDPILQQAKQIKAQVWEQRVKEYRATALSQVQALEVQVNSDLIDWGKAAEDGVDFSAGVPYNYLKEEADDRYLFGVDMSTGAPVVNESDIELLTTAPEEPSYLWDMVLGIRHGGMRAVVNASRIIRDNITPLGPLDKMDVKVRELFEASAFSPYEWNEMPFEIRASFYRLASEPGLKEMLESTAPETMPGQMVSGLTNFMMHAYPATRFSRAMLTAARGTKVTGAAKYYVTKPPITRGAKFIPRAGEVIGGMGASMVAWDHGEPTVFNLIQQFIPEEEQAGVLGEIARYLASDPQDSYWEDKIKQPVADAIMNVAMMGAGRGILKGITHLRHAPWTKAAALQLQGYAKLANMHKTRGSFSMRPLGAADNAELEAWSLIIAGKQAKGQITKKQFIEQGAKTWDEESLTHIWDRARKLSQEARLNVRRLMGAPPRITSPQMRTDMVNQLSWLVEKNADKLTEAAAWWDNSAGAIKELAGESVEAQERLLRLFAIYGQSYDVSHNVGAVLRSLDELSEGNLKPHGRFPARMQPNLDQMMDLSKEWGLDTPGIEHKLLGYYNTLKDALRGTDVASDTVVVDTWIQRLMGYPNFPKGHQYNWASETMMDVTRQVNKTMGTAYKPREVQGMLWQYSQNVWKKQSRTGKVATFATELQRRTATIPWEAVPAPETGKLANFSHWPKAKQRQLTTWVSNIFKNADGSDQIAEKLGIKGLRFNETDAFGTWENSFNPNRVGKLRTAELVKVDPVQAELMALIRQYTMRQHSTMWWRSSSAGATDAFMFRVQGTPADDVLVKIYKAAKKVDPKAEGTFMNGEFHFLNVAETEEFVTKMRAVLDDPEVAKLIDKPASAAYKTEVYWYEHDWKADPAGEGILGEISARGRRDLLPWLRDKAREVDALIESVDADLKQFEIEDPIF